MVVMMVVMVVVDVGASDNWFGRSPETDNWWTPPPTGQEEPFWSSTTGGASKGKLLHVTKKFRSRIRLLVLYLRVHPTKHHELNM